jgi:hypothetical protein
MGIVLCVKLLQTGVDERVPRQSYRDQGSSHQQGCSSLYRFSVDRLRSVGGKVVDHSVVANMFTLESASEKQVLALR